MAEWMSRLVPAATLGWGTFSSTCRNDDKSNISLYFPKNVLRNETPWCRQNLQSTGPKSVVTLQVATNDLPPRVSCAVQAEGVNVLKCASLCSVLILSTGVTHQIDLKHSVSEDRRQNWDVSIRHRSFQLARGGAARSKRSYQHQCADTSR